jgi:SAM-dependent methyltransferase
MQCKTCGTIYASPRASHASRYAWLDERFSLGESAFSNALARKPALERISKILQQYLSGGNLLDVGCDLGDLFEYFRGPAWKNHGVELSPSAAEYASKTYGAKVHAGFISQAGFPNAFFDLVTMLDMFYHLEDPRADLKEVFRIVQPGGYLAIEVSGLSYYLLRSIGIVSLLIDRTWTRLDSNSVYLFYFSPAGLRKLVEDVGFRVISTHVVESPVSSNRLRNLLVGAHGSLLRLLMKFSPAWMGWSPKYLLVARRGHES